tara:strand:- start:3670 stop:5028 length:1359 start_codon:yes stop_codon:yes gene_type:complete
MSKSLDLRQQRVPLAQKMRGIAEKCNKEGWTNEDRTEFDNLEKEIDSLASKAEDIDREERAAAQQDARNAGLDVQKHFDKKDKSGITAEMRANAFRAWCFSDRPSSIRPEWREDAEACGVKLDSPEMSLGFMKNAPRSLEEVRAMIKENITYRATTAQSLTNAAGGFTVADDLSLMGSVEQALLEYGGQRNLSRVIRTSNGADLPIPTNDDTTTSAAIITEGSTVTIQSLNFAQVTLSSYKYSSYVVSSFELLEDTAINLQAFIGEAIGVRIARGTNASFTNGTGSSQPKGAVHAATTTVTGSTATGGDITYNNIVDLYHSVDPAYRNSASFAFQCSDGILSEIRKLVDSNGVPLWNVSLRDDAPNLLLGTAVNINQDMTASSTASAEKILIAGDFSKHIIRDVADLRLRRLDERLALSDQVGWVAFSRHDSAILFSTSATASQPLVALLTT